MGGEHGIDHAHDGALLGEGECLDPFELLLNLRRRPALAGSAPGDGGRPDQFLDADAELLGEGRQRAGEQAQPPRLVVRESLLGDAEMFGELHLGQSARLEK